MGRRKEKVLEREKESVLGERVCARRDRERDRQTYGRTDRH